MQPRSISTLQKIDSIVEQLLQKFQDIFEVAVIEDKTKEMLSVGSLTIESDALVIIRLCEDLLTITRSLKETWCTGSLKVKQNEDIGSKSDIGEIFDQFNELTDKISQFENKRLASY